jgi:hypothetical protein
VVSALTRSALTRSALTRSALAGSLAAWLTAGLAASLGAWLAGCGLVDGPPLPGPPGGSLGPAFGESTPIEVCEAGARVVPPGVAAVTALCVPDAAQSAACASPDDCEPGEDCACGRCLVRACLTTASCAPGEQCRAGRCAPACASDEACPAGERCVGGGCARPCGGDGACRYGERCDALDDVCVTTSCALGSGCGAGQTCTEVAATRELREPFVLELGGQTLALVEVRTPSGPEVRRARVLSPTRWELDLAPLATGVGAPSALLERIDGAAGVDDVVRLAVARPTPSGSELAFGRLEHLGDGAPDVDGGARATLDEPSLVPTGWEGARVGSPSLVSWQGALYVAYEGGDGAGVGLARREGDGEGDGDGWARLGEAPIASPASVEDPLHWRQLSFVGAPSALASGGALRVFFTGVGVEGGPAEVDGALVPAEANESLGLVASRELPSFSRYPTGPVLARRANLRVYLGEREPSLRVLAGGELEVVFVARGAPDAPLTGLARAVAP